jgi:hypothetical protein
MRRLWRPGFAKQQRTQQKLNTEQQNNVAPTTITVILVSEPFFLVCKSLYHHYSRTNDKTGENGMTMTETFDFNDKICPEVCH